jgi:predicted nucleic acid-binding protein
MGYCVIAFFDASALIYLIEGAEPFGTAVRAALAQAAIEVFVHKYN